MKAIVLSETGGPEQLALQDVPDPDLSEGQSLVHVRAAGVNFLDLLVRQGDYPQAPPLPTILGAEVAGRDGGRPARHRAADRRRLRGARRCRRSATVPAARRARPFAEGAAFLLTYLTAWIPLTRQVRARAGPDGARARRLGRRRLRRDPDRAAPRRACRRHGEHRGEAALRRRGRAPRGVRLRRVRRARAARPRSSIRSAARVHGERSRRSRRSGRSSPSATPAAGGRSSTRPCSSAGTSASRASTSAG